MPARTKKFSNFKDPDYMYKGEIVRVIHSAKDKMSSGFGNASGEVADKAALGGATVNAACTVAVAAGAVGTFAVVASGPFAAAGLGVVGLVLAAKSSYSNRDKAHNKLMPYVWSFIDDVAPKKINEANSKDIGAAALSLISDGQPQQKLMDSKFRRREEKFNQFAKEYHYVSNSHIMYCLPGSNKRAYKSFVISKESERQQLLQKAFGHDGAVKEYMRRLAHFGNYLQAPVVLGRVMQKQMGTIPDLAKTVAEVRKVRLTLKEFQKAIEDHDSAFRQAYAS